MSKVVPRMTVERPKTVPNVTARSRLGIPEILDGSVVYMVVKGVAGRN